MAALQCLCTPNTLQASCTTPDHSGAEILATALIVLAGLLVYRIDRCCGDVEESDGEEDEPPSGMFS
jgi:hypothetical protein